MAAYDPVDDGEHDDEGAKATDSDPATDWRTEEYQDFAKDGVGLVLRGSRGGPLETHDSSEPGFKARVRAGRSPSGPFENVSGEQGRGRT